MSDYQKLFKKYPDFFRHVAWIECGPGWYKIIEALTENIVAIVTQHDHAHSPIVPTQIKEKHGTLRFYMTELTHEIDALIRKAETESEITCDECGEPGLLRTHEKWFYRTRCDKHIDKLNEK